MKLIIEKHEPTYYNALAAVHRYKEKYGLLDASVKKGYVDETEKKRINDYLHLEDDTNLW